MDCRLNPTKVESIKPHGDDGFRYDPNIFRYCEFDWGIPDVSRLRTAHAGGWTLLYCQYRVDVGGNCQCPSATMPLQRLEGRCAPFDKISGGGMGKTRRPGERGCAHIYRDTPVERAWGHTGPCLAMAGYDPGWPHGSTTRNRLSGAIPRVRCGKPADRIGCSC